MAKMMIPKSEARSIKIFTGFPYFSSLPTSHYLFRATVFRHAENHLCRLVVTNKVHYCWRVQRTHKSLAFAIHSRSVLIPQPASQPIRFTLLALNTTAIIRLASAGDVDFVFLTPSTYACLDAAVGLSPIAATSHNVAIAGGHNSSSPQAVPRRTRRQSGRTDVG